MTIAKSLSTSTRKTFTPLILLRDYKFDEPQTCKLCQKPFSEFGNTARTFDHIINDHSINELWNLWFVHFICNQQKKAIQQKYANRKILAPEEMRFIKYIPKIIEDNKKWQETFNFENYQKKKNLDSHIGNSEDSVFLDVSNVLHEVTQSVLQEYIEDYNSHFAKRELAAIIASRTQAKIQHGSIQASMNHLSVFVPKNHNT